MPGQKHSDLVRLGAAWLRRNGFAVIATEIDAVGSREKPDVIGFRSLCSAVIEVKTSRGDFRADRIKPERNGGPGLGLYRFYLCPDNLLSTNDVPPGWGLLTEAGGKIVEVIRPSGNHWPAAGNGDAHWKEFQHEVNEAAERRILYSIARRLSSAAK